MSTSDSGPAGQRWVLQFCHGYDGPFLDCARQYAVLFQGTELKVCTVYLTGAPSIEVEAGSASDEVIFLDYRSKDVRGLKLKAIRDLKRIAASRNFSLCIAHRFKPIYVALLATALPVIGVHHAFGVYGRLSRRMFINRFRRRLLLLGVSNAVRDEIRRDLPDWSERRIETLYNRIDIATVQAEQVSRAEARAHLGLRQDAWVIGNVGRLHPDKDQATLIRGFALALPQLPAGSLLAIMGSGKLEGALKTLASELGVGESVRFLGQVANGRRYFKAFDVFALSSDHEPFGMVLLEAMAAGVAVIGSGCGGAPEVINNTARLFDRRELSGLAQLLVKQSAMNEEMIASLRAEQDVQLRAAFSDEVVRLRFLQYMKVLL